MPSVSDISVVIRCYTAERWDWLAEAVASAQDQTLAPREVVVVVDHNPELLARARAALVGARVVENSRPQGSAGAWNSGIAAARGEVIAFLDDDAAADPSWLAELARGYDSRMVMGVGGSIEPHWLAGRPAWFPAEFDWVVGCTYSGAPQARARNLIGCNMSFRRLVFEELGGFRHGIGHVGGRPLGCDETELCIRLGQRWPSAILRVNPAARVRHKVPAARSRWAYFRARCAMEGRSKALVARLVGGGDATSHERDYVRRTLPAGVLRGALDAVHGDVRGLARAGAIVAGLAVTAGSYAAARASQLGGGRRTAELAPPIPRVATPLRLVRAPVREEARPRRAEVAR